MSGNGKKNSNSRNISAKKPMSAKEAKEKAVNRYVFICLGLIMYIMPCISCLAIGIMSDGGGISPAFVFAIVVEVLSVPLGLLGINAMKKTFLRKWCVVIAAVLLVMHIVSAVMITTWYVIMAPTFVLLALFIPWSAVVEKV